MKRRRCHEGCEVHIVNHIPCEPKDEDDAMKEDALELAKLHKALYDAYIEVGFCDLDATALLLEVVKSK